MVLEPRSPGYPHECRCPALCSKDVLNGLVKCPFVTVPRIFFSKRIAWKSYGDMTGSPLPPKSITGNVSVSCPNKSVFKSNADRQQNEIQTRFFCSCDLDVDIKILKTIHMPKMNFLSQRFRKLEHYKQTDGQTQTNGQRILSKRS